MSCSGPETTTSEIDAAPSAAPTESSAWPGRNSRFRPVPWSMVAATGVAAAIAMWWGSRGSVHSFVNDWDTAQSLWRGHGALACGLGAAVAAYVGQWRLAIASGDPRVIESGRYARSHEFPVVAVTLVGMTIGAAPAAVAIARSADEVAIEPWSVVSQLLATVAVVAVGYLVGLMFSHVLTPIGVVLGVVGATYLVYGASASLDGSSLYSPAPFWMEFDVPFGWQDRPIIGFLRSVLFALVIFASADATVQTLRGASRRRSLAVFAVPFVLAASMIVAQPELVEEDPAQMCSEDNLVCVPRDAAAYLPEFHEAARSVTDRFGFGAAQFASLDGGVVSVNIQTDSKPETMRQIVFSASSALVTGDCDTPDPRTLDIEISIDTRVIDIKIPDPYPKVSDQQIRDWLDANAEALASCQPTRSLE